MVVGPFPGVVLLNVLLRGLGRTSAVGVVTAGERVRAPGPVLRHHWSYLSAVGRPGRGVPAVGVCRGLVPGCGV
jgi:hypothetical protein